MHPKAAEFLERCEPQLGDRIRDRLKDLEEDPKARGERLRHSPYWRLRVGSYRAIYVIDESERRVVVLFIGHRREVYDDFSRIF